LKLSPPSRRRLTVVGDGRWVLCPLLGLFFFGMLVFSLSYGEWHGFLSPLALMFDGVMMIVGLRNAWNCCDDTEEDKC
jgi:hypothetical protein